MTRALVVVESMFGNTRAVADAVAEGLAEQVEVSVVDVGAAPVAVDRELDLVVVGGPTHAFGMSRPSTRESALAQGAPETATAGAGIREWVAGLPHDSTAAVATFDTRIKKPGVPGSAAKAAGRRLRHAGLHLVDEPHSFWVKDTDGPLLPGELDRAREWGRHLATTVQPH